jgi:hypothetical protein
VLRGDVGHVGSVLCPQLVGFMKPGKLWKKKSTSPLLVCITVLLAATNTSSRARLRLVERRVLTITVGKRWEWMPRGAQEEVKTRKQNTGGHPWTTTSSDVPERKLQAKL